MEQMHCLCIQIQMFVGKLFQKAGSNGRKANCLLLINEDGHFSIVDWGNYAERLCINSHKSNAHLPTPTQHIICFLPS
jgi:hypothetical protein